MNKEILIPQGIYRVGRDLPAGVYLITALVDGGMVTVKNYGESYKNDLFILDQTSSLSCQLDLEKGDTLHLHGKFKIKRIGDFPCANKIEKAVPQNATAERANTKQRWDQNLSKYFGVYGNGNTRLVRGLEYFKQGRVESLLYGKGVANALVKGSNNFSYEVSVFIKKANSTDDVMPTKEQISFDCNCPDQAKPCKHIAAVLYAISSDLGKNPYLLHLLRDQSVTQ